MCIWLCSQNSWMSHEKKHYVSYWTSLTPEKYNFKLQSLYMMMMMKRRGEDDTITFCYSSHWYKILTVTNFIDLRKYRFFCCFFFRYINAYMQTLCHAQELWVACAPSHTHLDTNLIIFQWLFLISSTQTHTISRQHFSVIINFFLKWRINVTSISIDRSFAQNEDFACRKFTVRFLGNFFKHQKRFSN